MRVELDQLLAFQQIVKTGSFTRAAEALSMSQPAVSAHINRLERRLQTRLIERQGRRIWLTSAGHILAQYADRVEELVELLEAAADEATATMREVRGHLRIGASTSIGIYLLPSVLGQFKRHYPAVDIALDIGVTTQLIEATRNNAVDVAIIEGIMTGDDLETELLREEPLELIVPPSHRWLRRSTNVSVHDLIGEPFIGYRERSGMQTAIEDGLQAHGITLTPSITINNIVAVVRAVEEGLGVSFAPRLAIARELEHGSLRTVQIEGLQLSRPFRLIMRHGKFLSRAGQAFVQFLRTSTAG